jgi:predicted aminopeptidase
MGRTLRLTIGACLVAFALALALTPPSGPRSMREFNPTRLADLELRMWKAYYAKDRTQLFGLLVTMLREQYRYSWATATREAFHLARAASTFGDLKGDYEQVLPDLEAGYATAKSWLDAGFDPRAVAQAELDWWVARRIPGQNSAEQVGHLIAQEYALLYETSAERVAPAALLRATAAKMRDEQAAQPDWDRIGRLLEQSYRELHAALAVENV